MGDCKSLQGWSNLFRRRITNPPKRLTGFIGLMGVCHKSHPIRPERAEAPSPGHRPGCSGWCNAPCKGKSFKIRSKFKAFALTGRQVSVYNTQGDALG